MLIHIRVHAVDEIVRGHNSPWLSFSHGDLEGSEVQLSQRSLADPRIDGEPVGFLLVTHKIYPRKLEGERERITSEIPRSRLDGAPTLDGGSHPLLLQSADVLGCQLAREQRIFGERFEISTAQGMAVHAHSRGEKDVGRSRLDLVGEVLANIVQEVLVPCGG